MQRKRNPVEWAPLLEFAGLGSLAASDTATAAWTFGGRRHGQPQNSQNAVQSAPE
jgi:hypothetical protein